jgi:hypothetical protein
MQSALEAAKNDEALSNFAFNFKLLLYISVSGIPGTNPNFAQLRAALVRRCRLTPG